jgi:probable HAF family extracellular repeat protein
MRRAIRSFLGTAWVVGRVWTWRAALVLLVSTAARPAGAQAFKITDLGTLPGHTESFAYGVNNLGQVTGHSGPGDGSYRGYIWLPAPAYGLSAGMHEIPGFGGSRTATYGINELGQVNGAGRRPGDAPEHALLWLPSAAYGLPGGSNDLGTLGGELSATNSINNDGIVAGYAWTADGDFRACLWNGSSITDIDPSGPKSAAARINHQGLICGYRKNALDLWEAVIWNGSSPTPLGGLGGNESMANWNNDAGACVGFGSLSGDAVYRAALWLTAPAYGRAAGVYNLGTLGSYRHSEAAAINNAGWMVGRAMNFWYNGFSPGRAVLWSPGGLSRTDLNTMIPPRSGWVLQAAWGISENGMIVGNGTYNGVPRGFLLTPVDLAGITIAPAIVVGSKPAQGTVTLSDTAPPGGALVRLSVNNAGVTIPATVTVPAGATSVNFTIRTTAVTAPKTITITARLGMEAKSGSFRLRPISVGSLTLSPDELIGGDTGSATVVLECPAAPGDIVVTLASNSGAAVPAVSSLTIPAGSTTATFAIHTRAVAKLSAITIKATANGLTKTATLMIYPP